MVSITILISWVWFFMADDLQYVFCEKVLIDLREDKPQVNTLFNDRRQIITDEQMKLFQIDEDNKLIAMWNKLYPDKSPFKCVVLKGKCGDGEPHILQLTTLIHYGDFKSTSQEKTKDVQFLYQTYKNNGTRAIKWTPTKEFNHVTRITRTHSKEATNAWLLEDGTVLNMITSTGLIKLESKWSESDVAAISSQLSLGSTSEVTVLPGETIRTYITYKERPYTLELTYHMTIGNEFKATKAVDKNGESSHGPMDWKLTNTGKPTTYNHTVKLEFTDIIEIALVIKNSLL